MQSELEFLDQQLQFGLGLRVASETDLAPVGGRHEHVDHLRGGDLLQHTARGQSGCELFESMSERDVQTVGEESDEDVRFDAFFVLMENGSDRQVTLEAWLLHASGAPPGP